MVTYRALIVDDHREVRRTLRSTIKTLDADFEVVTVPSGEEALLEFSSDSYDLVVVDIRLPGITGPELIAKLRKHNPDVKVILITGLADAAERQEVRDAGADFFFLKPIEVADFLDAVERCLGLVSASSAPVVAAKEPTESISERLVSLRAELRAISAILLDDRGRVLARAGNLSDASDETGMLPALMAAFSASERIAHWMDEHPPRDLMYFSGQKYDLYLAHVGESYALLVVTDPVPFSDQINKSFQIVQKCLQDLFAILPRIGVPLKHEWPASRPDIDEVSEQDPEDAPVIEALFEKVDSSNVNPDDADAFWASVSETTTLEDVTKADALSYEQARQLGLTPEDEE